MEDFNKYQWSRFIGGRDGDQVVVRGNDFESFLLDVGKMKKEFETVEVAAKEMAKKVENDSGHYCSVCHGPTEYRTGTSKAGKPYKGYFCTSSKDHPVEWVR